MAMAGSDGARMFDQPQNEATANVPPHRIRTPEEIALAYIPAMPYPYFIGEIVDVSGGQTTA